MKKIARVLVIRFDDLSGFVLSLAAIQRIRLGHPGAKITLLTSPAFASLARACPAIDQVEAPATVDPARLARAIRRQRFDRVYDLDAAPRSISLRRWAWPTGASWSVTSQDNAVSLIERHKAQLNAAGVRPAPERTGDAPDMTWLADLTPPDRPTSGGSRPRPYVLLVPGGGPAHRRWPAGLFGAAAQALGADGFDIVVIGEPHESRIARHIQKHDPRAHDLTSRTDYAVIAALAFKASLAIGHESGLLTLVAAAGAPTIALSSGRSDPMPHAPRGHVAVLHSADMAELPLDQVLRAARCLTPAPVAA